MSDEQRAIDLLERRPEDQRHRQLRWGTLQQELAGTEREMLREVEAFLALLEPRDLRYVQRIKLMFLRGLAEERRILKEKLEGLDVPVSGAV